MEVGRLEGDVLWDPQGYGHEGGRLWLVFCCSAKDKTRSLDLDVGREW